MFVPDYSRVMSVHLDNSEKHTYNQPSVVGLITNFPVSSTVSNGISTLRRYLRHLNRIFLGFERRVERMLTQGSYTVIEGWYILSDIATDVR